MVKNDLKWDCLYFDWKIDLAFFLSSLAVSEMEYAMSVFHRIASDWFFLCCDFASRIISMETIQAVYFCYGAKLANSNLATKTAKKKKVNIVILNSETTRKSLKD